MSLAIDHPSGRARATRKHDESRAGAPVVLRGRPLVGHLPELRADPLRFFTRIARDHGDAVELHFGFDKVLMLNNPAMIRHVLQDNRLNYEKSKFYDVMRAVLGNGIFLAEGDEWLSQRRTAARSFQGCQLRRMTAAMQDAVGDLQERWSGLAARGAVIDLIPEMMRLTLDILMRTLFSLRLDDQYAEIFQALTVVLRDAERRIWSPFNPPRWLPTPRNREVRAALRVLDSFVFGLIEKRCAERAQAGESARESEGDLLDLLLDNRNGRSDRQICDQFQSMILAGHETTANGLSWCCYLLSLHPESLRRLRSEVREVLQGRPAGFADLPALKYTRMVFDETLRLYPPLWTFSRVAAGRDQRHAQHVRGAPPAGAVGQPGGFRSLALRSAAEEQPALRLLPLQRRPAQLPRRAFCDPRVDDCPGRHRRPLRPAAAAGPERGA
jgi:cytochrome P450